MFAEELRRVLSCPVERDKPLSPLTTLGVGGVADCYVEPDSAGDLQALVAFSRREDLPLYVLGGGSNVLFPDGRVPGIVLSTRRRRGLSWRGDTAEVQMGCPLQALLDGAVREGLGGLEFAAGIPGTVGGAVAGNAGAGGHGVAELLTELTALEPDGRLRRWGEGEFPFAYRSFPLARGRLFLSCRMRFTPCPPERIREELERFRALRRAQPGGRSAGCTFKNPAGESAGGLLDRCGCKGMSVGDAVVSDQHANFILNRGRASSGDVFELIAACRDRVFQGTGILLEPEIKLLGWEPPARGGAEGKRRLCVA